MAERDPIEPEVEMETSEHELASPRKPGEQSDNGEEETGMEGLQVNPRFLNLPASSSNSDAPHSDTFPWRLDFSVAASVAGSAHWHVTGELQVEFRGCFPDTVPSLGTTIIHVTELGPNLNIQEKTGNGKGKTSGFLLPKSSK